MSSKLIRPTRALPLLAVLIACMSLPAIASAATSYSMKWSRSALLENPSNGGRAVVGRLRAHGGDNHGHDDDWHNHHGTTPASKSKALLCVAGDPKGHVWATAHPSRTAKGWRRETIDAGNAITSIACPSTEHVRRRRRVRSRDARDQAASAVSRAGAKTGAGRHGHAAWRGYAGFAAVACPDDQGCASPSTTPRTGRSPIRPIPTGPASAWTLADSGQRRDARFGPHAPRRRSA